MAKTVASRKRAMMAAVSAFKKRYFAMLLGLAVAACAGASQPSAAPEPDVVATSEPSAPAPRVVIPEVPATGEGVERVAAFRAAEKTADRDARWKELQRIAAELRTLADPRAANALAEYLAAAPSWQGSGEKLHFQTELAMALGEIGDLRALPTLARRLSVDTLEGYGDKPFERELRRTDSERVLAALLIGDLTILHPEAVATVRSQTEGALLAWAASWPVPHGYALRALSTMQSTRDPFPRELLQWADPRRKLPAEGEEPPMRLEFYYTEIALRYLGRTRHPAAFKTLKKQLGRREPRLDVTNEGLKARGLELLGMTLASFGIGASDGFSELGDTRAFPLLLAYIDNDKENERSRLRACEAAVWLSGDAGAKPLATRMAQWSRENTPKAAFRRGCLWSALAVRPVRGLDARTLLELFPTEPTAENRIAAAHAAARAGIDAASEQKLAQWVNDPRLGVAAAFALLLGGTPGGARNALQNLSDDALGVLSELYLLESIRVSEGDIETGWLPRWVENTVAVASVERSGKPLAWARVRLGEKLRAIEYEDGPHLLTRTVMRARLLEAAYRGSIDERKRAVGMLELLHERGMLLRIAAVGDELAPFAAAAEKRVAASPL